MKHVHLALYGLLLTHAACSLDRSGTAPSGREDSAVDSGSLDGALSDGAVDATTDSAPDAVVDSAVDTGPPPIPDAEPPRPTSLTEIGIFYSTWHCVASTESPESRGVHDLSEIQAGRSGYGPVHEFHWWDQPEAGYYCLTRNDELLGQHAELLRDAGIDFVFIDATNHADVGRGSDRTRAMVLEPFERMLAVWSRIPGAPQIVPWVPVVHPATNASHNTVDALLERLGRHPGMHFELDGKPLVLVTDNATVDTSEAKLEILEEDYTLRRMWGAFSEPGEDWSFMQPCRRSPTSAAPCRQRSAIRDGEVEQISITVAYQETYMNVPSATPRHGGRTFQKQFWTLLDDPLVPIATITGWNEWIAQRQACDEDPTCPCGEYPNGCFIEWDSDYSRDIEPAQNGRGDFYYRLMSACISLLRSGETCESQPLDLCCL